MLVYFPQMHKELVDTNIEGILLFNPGMEPDKDVDSTSFKPSGFPMEPDLCKRMVDEFMQYGELFKRPGEMASYIGQVAARANVESDRSIEAELMDRLDNVKPEVDYKPALIQAQLLIALSYAYEEKIIELSNIEKNLNSSWSGFGEKLGLAADEIDSEERMLGEVISNAPVVASAAFVFPWKKTLEGFSAYLPDGAVLVTSDNEAVSIWEDRGIPFEKSEIDGADIEFHAPVYKFLCYEKSEEGKPWLDRELRIAVIAE
ncbi:hypothetical protein [Maridesulfovibrio bastinii]|uniref:hypothetical protein n=1 Tax=Maridesulfovibrio bastinii TaxID=47157 RepID=UPI00040E6AA6|nr:hypothetical protein [Maridesulfovibrio bastinii]